MCCESTPQNDVVVCAVPQGDDHHPPAAAAAVVPHCHHGWASPWCGLLPFSQCLGLINSETTTVVPRYLSKDAAGPIKFSLGIHRR
jgi:hypothetical protein